MTSELGRQGDTGGQASIGSDGNHRTSRLAPWRAAARLASRDVRRRPGRTVLVGILVGLPVAAVSAGSIVVRTLDLTPDESWRQDAGQADAVAKWGGPYRLSDTAPTDDEAETAIRRAYPTADEVVTTRWGPDASTDTDERLRMVEVGNPPLATSGMFDGSIEVTHGRAPERSGEAAVSQSVLDGAGIHIGEHLDLVLAGSVRVTGTVIDAHAYDRDLVVTHDPPAAHGDRYQVAYISVPAVDGAETGGARPAGGWAPLEEAGVVATYGYDEGGNSGVTAGYVIAGVALLMVAIVASAAFAVGARRQLRLLGIVSAAGGSPADLQRAVLLEGTVTGLVASIAGLGVAVVGTAAAYPFLDDLANRGVGPLEYRPVELALAAVLGTASATGAAWLPARGAGRMPTLAALAGRRPQSRLPAIVPVLGAVAVATGVVALRLWRSSGSGWGVGLAAAVTVVLGATAVAPVLVAQAEPLAGRLRRGARLAARGLARQRLRSGAVVAAVMAPVGVTVLVACAVVTDEARERATWESSDDSQSPGDNEVLFLANGASAEDAEATVAAIREIVPEAEEGPVLAAVTPDAPPDAGLAAAVRVQVEGGDAGGYERYVIVTAADYLESAGAGRHALDVFEDGGVVVPGTLTPTSGADRGSRPPGADERVPVLGADVELHGEQVAVAPALRAPSSGSIVFVSRDTAERWGAEVVEIGTFFVAPEPLTDEQADALMDVGTTDNDTWARQYLIAGEPNGPGQIQTGAWRSEYRDESMIARVVAVGASLLVTLAVVAVALALTAAESSDENQLLEAIGSPPSIRRSVSAWQALLLPAMAVTLAVPIALVAAAALLGDHSGGTQTGPSHVIVPWLTVAAVVVLLPLASGGITWVGATFTGRRRRDLAAAVVGGD